MIEVSFVKEFSKVLCDMYDDGIDFFYDIEQNRYEILQEKILEYVRTRS